MPLSQCSFVVLIPSISFLKRTKFTLPDFYDFNALEPVISAEIMQIHHQKHRAVCLRYQFKCGIGEIWRSSVPRTISTPKLPFNLKSSSMAEAILIIQFLEESLSPKDAKGNLTVRWLMQLKIFWIFWRVKTLFTSQTAAVQGSGWGWLVKKNKAEVVPFYFFIFYM